MDDKRWSHYPDRILASVGVVALLASLFGTCQQLKMTRQALNFSQRPWMGVSEVRLLTPLDGQSDGLNVRVSWKNYGQGPARNLQFQARLIFDRSKPSKSNTRRVNQARLLSFGMLPPGEVMNWDVGPIRASPPVRQSLLSGPSVLRVKGVVHYEDVFGTKHWTKLCASLRRSSGEFVPCSGRNKVNPDTEADNN